MTNFPSGPETRHESDDDTVLDPVDEASADSFPASDPPNWAIGQQRDPDHLFTEVEEEPGSARKKHNK
jgi:hypothetical protein